MKWLFIIDPIEKLNPETDTTYALMKEAFSRKTETFIATIQDLQFEKVAKVSAQRIQFARTHSVGQKKIFLLNDFDLILMRKEPPYDLGFHYATELLSLAKTKVVNSPQALRDFNEKLITLQFPELMPETLVSSNVDQICKFIKSKNIFFIIKALDSFQGRIIQKVHSKNAGFKKVIETSTDGGKMPIMVQEFLPNIIKGDKRVLILGGKFLGAVNRMPKPGSYISNFGAGGTGHKTMLTAKEQSIVKRVGPFLLKQGIHFAGLDIIDGRLTEINITCPTGLQHINRLENRKLEKDVVDYLERLP